MIDEGMTVILDSGSTTTLIAEGLMTAKNITVITNSLPAAFALSENKDITLVVVVARSAINVLDAWFHCRAFIAGY